MSVQDCLKQVYDTSSYFSLNTLWKNNGGEGYSLKNIKSLIKGIFMGSFFLQNIIKYCHLQVEVYLNI